MFIFSRSTFAAAAVALGCLAGEGRADTIFFGGLITQSTQDFTGPAVNNPVLNNISDGDRYTVALHFSGTIPGPGTFMLTGATFSDAAAGASETSFDFSSPSLTITPNGAFDDFSVLLCLTTGSGCAVGNQLDANFEIPAASLHSTTPSCAVMPAMCATGLDQPHPLDLLEDDGVTDIHGSVDSYSYTSTVPEPSPLGLVGCALALLGFIGQKNYKRRQRI